MNFNLYVVLNKYFERDHLEHLEAYKQFDYKIEKTKGKRKRKK